jgi:hypothetical protein
MQPSGTLRTCAGWYSEDAPMKAEREDFPLHGSGSGWRAGDESEEEE